MEGWYFKASDLILSTKQNNYKYIKYYVHTI